jgi:hypothetical protein
MEGTSTAVPQTSVAPAPQFNLQKEKKSIVLMIVIHLFVVAAIGFLVYQNIQLKKKSSLSQINSSATPTPIPSDNPVKVSELVKDCSGNDKYSISIKEPSKNNGMSEFLVKYNSGAQEYTINEDVAYCMGLMNNFLVLDSGTSAGPRGLIVYDLDKRVRVYKGSYVKTVSTDTPVISNDTISYWEPSSEMATEDNCPDFLKNKSMGGGSAIDVYTKLNLVTLNKELLGQERCDYRE